MSLLSYVHRDRPEWAFVQAEYAAILHGAIEGRQRVIPVMVDEVEVPPLLASRVWVDFRDAEGPRYDQKLEELVRALRGKKAKDRPERTGAIAAPSEHRYRPEGALRRTLRIGLGVPQIRIDLHWLGRQRQELGEERFREVLREHLDEQSATNVSRMLDQAGSAEPAAENDEAQPR